jgi:hypothetical protein
VQRTFAFTPLQIGMVELDALVVHQKHINLSHVATLAKRIAAATTQEDVFRICLPLGAERCDPATGSGGGQGGWTFKSPSNDFRVLGSRLLDPASVADLEAFSGVPTHVVAIAVGYGVNHLSAIHAEGRLVLWNGSHRAYALRGAGHTHVPCLIQEISRRDELGAIGGPDHDVISNPDRYLVALRPPMLKDYFDEQLRLVAHVQPTVRQVQVGFQSGWADVPA